MSTETATTSAITEEQVLQALRAVKDPDLHKDIVTLNMIRDVAICGGIVSFRFVLTTPACPVRDQLKFEAEKVVIRTQRKSAGSRPAANGGAA